MKRSRFTEEQIIGVLREHEAGVKTGDLCRKRGISGATFFKWKPARCHSGDEHQPALGIYHRRQLARSLRASHWQIFWKVQVRWNGRR